jgi:putative hemolysin
MTTRTKSVARMGLLGVFVGVLLFAALLGTVRPTSAQPITTSSDGWTKANFASSCQKAGGKAYEIDEGDINYSYCTFPDGTRNRCDWIKKTCTFGEIVAQPQGRRANVGGTIGNVTTAG